MFHLEASPGNLSWEQYELIRDTRGVREAYPIAVGDNYHGYRLVGTLPELFLNHEWKKGESTRCDKEGESSPTMQRKHWWVILQPVNWVVRRQ